MPTTPGRRRSVSMRDHEYIAIALYKREMEINNAGYAFTITGVLGQIMRGEIPPIPKKLLDAGKARAKLEREERAKNPKPPIEAKEPEPAPEDIRPAGGIFTF